MKIAVNTRLLLPNKLEGIGWFTYESFQRICTQHPEHEFLFIFDRKFDKQFIFSENITPVVAPPPTRHPYLWFTWFEFVVPYILKKHKANCFVSPDGFLSLRTKVPSIAVIHDINFVHRPQDLPKTVRNFYNHYFPLYAAKAERIATVSEFSKNDIATSYHIDKNKIDVVYNGVNEKYRPLNESEKQQVRHRFSKGEPYFVFVGALHPRKNVARLLAAFNIFKKRWNAPFKLLIVGAEMFQTGEISEVYKKMEFSEDVIFTGRLSHNDLSFVVGAAFALTFVPYFEGFGIPIVEAMACNTPVITSNVTSMPEVAGEAALFVDPFDIEDIAEKMFRIVQDETLRNQLIEKAKLQVKKFSWNNTANNLWNSIMKAF